MNTVRLRRWWAMVLVGGWMVGCASPAMAAPAWPPPPAVDAQAAVLIDARTGAVLYEKQAFRQMDPASLTKMMTALLVIRHGDLEREVTISAQAARTEGSRLRIAPGERYTVLDLLRGLLLRSGNDAAVALAEAEAGSVRRFVAEMNVEAQRLGAFNTQYENPHGLTAPGHFSTAYDLALIARTALNQPLFREIVAQRSLTIQERSRGRTRTVHNTNLLLEAFPGADGIKTGTTSAAGKCLAASATRNGQQLIAVVLKSPDRWGDAARLLAWGFDHWQERQVVAAGQAFGQVAVQGGVTPTVTAVAAHSLWAVYPSDYPSEVHPWLQPAVPAPVRAGATLGRVVVLSPVEPAQSTALTAKTAVPRLAWWKRWLAGFLGFFNYQDGAA